MRPDIELAKLETPTISVVICNYNYARFLRSAVLSALEQTYPVEVVVVDDGSTDDSRAVLQEFEGRCTCVFQANAGQRQGYLTGFQHSSGEVVVFLDADDYLARDAAEVLAQSFDAGVAKAHFRLGLVDEGGGDLGVAIPTRLAHGDVFSRLITHGLLYASPPGSGNAYRRSVLTQLMPLPADPVERHAADFFTIYAAPAFGTVHAIHRVLGHYRVHASGLAASGQFMFGNAVQGFDERQRARQRAQQFRQWIAARVGPELRLPQEFFDFSQTKVAFCQSRFDGSYLRGFRHASRTLPKLLASLWLDRDFSLAKRLALSVWAALVMVLPHPIGRPVANYVANPASRRT